MRSKTHRQRAGCLVVVTFTGLALSIWYVYSACAQLVTPPGSGRTLLNEPIDVSPDFFDFANTYFIADRLVEFDPGQGRGTIVYQRAQFYPRMAFNNILPGLKNVGGNEFPENEYEVDPRLPFGVDFVSARTIRLRIWTGPRSPERDSLMLVGDVPRDTTWRCERIPGGYRYTSQFASVTVRENPWHVEIRDSKGRLLTRTIHRRDNSTTFTPVLPFGFVRRVTDYARRVAAVFELAPGEKIFGCGEAFTEFNKRGQRIVLWVDDANGTQNETMYKPIPFFLSSRGYGMFIHSSAPITCDFGRYFSGVASLMLGDDELDLFIFVGAPKDILSEYTKLTGRAPVPPLWSFGLWMSRCTYNSEAQVREVASKLRENKIPCDVIHLDTGWFETDWRCNYEFSTNRFTDPARMMADLRRMGFRISVWQLPYFTPQNSLFSELVRHGFAVRDPKGSIPYEDAILDFANPTAVEWYQAKLNRLLSMGVAAIKADFGEAAPPHGLYASGRTGHFEHNLYPLRYNRAVAEITKRATGENIIWARSAWAGSQRYPVHWGGDAESTDQGMAATVRGGLSLGLCGFTFWSHDVGGFTARPSDDLYLRWLGLGVFSSHLRCHGVVPKEPWEYAPETMDAFRKLVELRYKLLPYIYAQAVTSAELGLPMMRALFLEYPNDPGAWTVDDEYMFGADLLVAPLFNSSESGRWVYLPSGNWIDYQTGASYAGGWHLVSRPALPILVFVRDGAIIPHIAVAQSTAFADWTRIELVGFAQNESNMLGQVCLPDDNRVHEVRAVKTPDGFKLQDNPLARRVRLEFKHAQLNR